MKSHVLTAMLLWLFALSGFSQTDAQLFRQLESQFSASSQDQIPFVITSKSDDASAKWVEHARGQVVKSAKGIACASLQWFASKGENERLQEERASGLQMFVTPIENVVVILDMNQGNWRMRLQDVQLTETADGISLEGKYQNGTHTELFEIHFQTFNQMTAVR
ncbi:MAG: hypothetical protein MRY78_20150 [Saprospiraceae bacterium]|nr:hypothetical protein [Saprospiraceae bacterium]